jgi:hypothetical protein
MGIEVYEWFCPLASHGARREYFVDAKPASPLAVRELVPIVQKDWVDLRAYPDEYGKPRQQRGSNPKQSSP